jgi:hypothetical protein
MLGNDSITYYMLRGTTSVTCFVVFPDPSPKVTRQSPGFITVDFSCLIEDYKRG